MENPPASLPFVTTRWTLVIRTRGESSEARAALSELCEAYWPAVFAHLRRTARDEDRARELTQSFFARILSGAGLGGATPEHGRFRAFLLGAVNHFIADERDRERAAKRGGGAAPVSFEVLEVGGDGLPSVAKPGDHVFDRGWAVNLVNRALERLAMEYRAQHKEEIWSALKPWLLGEPAFNRQAGPAQQLGWTENAVRVAVHRMRRRFRELVRSEVSHTVDGDEAIRDEMRYLVEILGKN